jgi:hypothetical protein
MWNENLRIQEEAWKTVAENTEAIENPDRASFVEKMQPVIEDFVSRNGERAQYYVEQVRAL